MNREFYVQLTQEELRSTSFRSLGPVACALLIQLRALEAGTGSSLVSLSVREARKHLNVSQRPVERAFKALEAHGWIEEAAAAPSRRRHYLLKSPAKASHG